jgi:hypothetical protein
MEKINPNSTLNDSPTDGQIRAITKMCIILHINEPLEERVTTRWEARNLLYELQAHLKNVRRHKSDGTQRRS